MRCYGDFNVIQFDFMVILWDFMGFNGIHYLVNWQLGMETNHHFELVKQLTSYDHFQ